MQKYILLGITTGIILLNNKEKKRNIDSAEKLGWNLEYDNQNPYPGKVNYKKDKLKIGLNKELFYDLKKFRLGNFTSSITNPLGNTKNIVHQHYNRKVLNLIEGDKITGIQFKIATGYRGLFGEPSGNREWSTPSDFKSNNYTIRIGNMNLNSKLESDYQTNIDNCSNIITVKEGVEWKAEDWPFGKAPENNYGPILEFDTPFIYTGDDLFIEINYSDKESEQEVGTHAHGLVFKKTFEEDPLFKRVFRDTDKLDEYEECIEYLTQEYGEWNDSYSTYFNYTNKESAVDNEVYNDYVLDVQFEVDDVFNKPFNYNRIANYVKLGINQNPDLDMKLIVQSLLEEGLSVDEILIIAKKIGLTFEDIYEIAKNIGLSDEEISSILKNKRNYNKRNFGK